MTKNINEKPNILVIGDLMIDEYLWGNCERISPEAPVQIVDVKKETKLLGGAGNVINNLVSLGVDVEVISVIGDDPVGDEIKSMLENIDVKSYLVEQENRKTSRKTRLMASNSQVVRYDKESKEDISKQSQELLFDKFQISIQHNKNIEVILLSDYNKGVLTSSLVEKIINLANNHKIKVLVDPKGNDFTKYKNAYLLTPNKKEAQLASNIQIEDQESLKKVLKKLKNNQT